VIVVLDLTDREVIKYLCKKHGFSFSKDMGQNFMTDASVIDLISRTAAEDSDGVLEIGPGFGTLTAALGQRAKKVVSLEIDRRLEPVLKETLSGFDNVEIIWEDCMKADLKKILGEKFDGKVNAAANLPYYITTPIIMKLLEGGFGFGKIVVMVQKEVAERFCAKAGKRDYGAVTIGVDYRAEAKIIKEVGKESFIPSPKVDSAVVEMTLRSEPKVKPKDEKLFFSVIKASFSQRRKTLANALSNAGKFGGKDEIISYIESLGHRADVRGERLTIEEFAALSDILAEKAAEI